MANIAILGHGVVGSGVMEVLQTNKIGIEKKAGQELNIKYILDRRAFPNLPYGEKFIKDFDIIKNDPTVSAVVEVLGGVEPAFTFVKECLSRGKSVITSNKELVAAKGAELLALAAQNRCNFLFEASVGGGIPIIKPLHLCLGANEIDEIGGILNGTTNFILTKMFGEQMSFEKALALAQERGYAERDPSADVDGYDACRKICILASLAFGNHIYPDKVFTQGIREITLEDVAYAESWGGVIKLIGRCRHLSDGRIMVMVSPAFINRRSQLAGVDDVFNGILVRGNATGDIVFYGKGAGKLPTASAVVSDVIDAVRSSGTIATLQWKDAGDEIVAPFDQYPVTAYLRLKGDGVISKAQALFGPMQQLAPRQMGEAAFITPSTTEGELAAKVQALRENDICVLGLVRVLEL